MAEIASAYLSLIPSMKGASGAIEGEARSAGSVAGRSFGKMFALGAAVIAAAGVGKFLKGSIEEAREANKVGATTEQVIKATGGAANLTANQVGKLSTALSNKIGVDDEQIQQGANLLLTFKNVRNEVGKGADIFTRATQAGADLAAAGFGSIEGNAKQLGKALNDPLKGITALTRAGVTFTDKQKEQIKGFVESGDLLSAQKIILGEVEHQVGGVAAATATSTEKAKVAWGNLKEDLGKKLVPVVDRLADVFVSLAPKIGPALNKVGSLLKQVFGQAKAFLEPFIQTALSFFQGEGRSAIMDFATQAFGIFKSQVLPVLQTASNTFRNVVLPAVTSLVKYVATALFPIFKQVAAIVVGQVIPIFASLAKFLYGSVYPAVVQIVAAVAKNLKPVFDQLVSTLQTSVLPAVSKLLTAFKQAQPTIQKVVMVVLKIVGAVLKFAAAVLAKVLPALIRFVGFIIAKGVPVLINIVKAVAKVVGALIVFGKKVVDAVQFVITFQKGVAKGIGAVVNFFKKLPSQVKGFLRALPADLKRIGGDIVDGLKRGIEAAWHKVTDVVDSLIKKIPKKIRQIMGIASPSKVTTYLGKMVALGLADGIESSGKKVADATQKLVDNLKSKLDSLKSDFSSLKDSVAGAFTGNLFESTTASGFIANLLGTKGQLKNLMTAFNALVKDGWKPELLSQLFQSGNAGLILDLASADKATSLQAASLLGDVNKVSTQLGGTVAHNEFGDKLDKIEKRLAAIQKNTHDGPERTGKVINGTWARGRRLAHA